MSGPALVAAAVLALAGAAAPAATGDPNGRIAYAAGGAVHVVGSDGARGRTLAAGAAPSWSPGGAQIVFESARVPGYGLDIYVMNRDGTDQRRIVTHPSAGGEPPDNTRDDFEPTWSPDGDYIAFTTVRDGNAEIYRTDTTGHSTARLTTNAASDRDPSWSPNGRLIAFVSDRGGNDDVYAMSIDSTDVRQLTRSPGHDGAPAWSPDGRLLAFESIRGGNTDLYVVGVDGTEERRLTSDPAGETSPSWSPDGHSIVFARRDESGRRLAVLDIADGTTRVLAAPAAGDAPSWQPGVDLGLSVSATGPARRGRAVRIGLTVRNRLPSPAFYVRLTLSVPRGMHVVRAVGRGVACRRARPVTCSLRMLSAPVSVGVVVRPQRCGSFTLRASVSSVQRDVATRDNRRATRLSAACR